MTDENDLQRAMEQDVQRIEERIPYIMSKDDTAKIADRLREFTKAHDLNDSTVAKALAVSATSLSLFLRGKYPGRGDRIAKKAVSYMDSKARQRRKDTGRPGFVNTTVARKIADLIGNTEAFSEQECKIGIIVGDGGHGKSHCMKVYADSNPNTVYVELDGAMTSRDIFAEIAERVGAESDGSQSYITRKLIESLRHRHIIVMLDEASWLSTKQLDRLRQVVVVKSRCPLILAGNHGLLNTIRQSTCRRGAESLDQFTSRLARIINLDEIAINKDGGLYNSDDIYKLFQYGGVRLVDNAAKTLKSICKTPRSGRLRTCSYIITALHTSGAVKRTRQITAQQIIDAINLLELPVLMWLPMVDLDRRQDNKTAAAAAAG